MKILIAEDDRATRTRILAFLKEWGHEGIAASDGEEAWELFQSEEVSALNRSFSYDEESSQYFTVVYGVLDLRAGEFCYTSAGHPGPLVVSNGGGEQRKARPPAVGFLPEGNFQEERVACAPGDRMYFYTDGIFEVSNAEGEQFGPERLREVLVGAADLSLEESLACLRDRARSWAKDGVFDDDVSLIGVEICGEQA